MKSTATFDDLLARKLEREQRNGRTYEIPVRGMDHPLLFHHPSAKMQLTILDEVRHAEGLADVADLYVHLIYDCCPLFQQKDTQEGLDVVDPYDAVRAVFEPLEIIKIGDQFCDACGLTSTDDGTEGTLKN